MKPTRRGRFIFYRIVLPLVVLGVGGLAAMSVFRLSPSAARAEPARQIPVVEVVEVAPQAAVARVEATGTVVAAQMITITPEISGRVVGRSDALIPGGRLSEGEVIARIDARDYRLSIDQEQARVTSAQLEVQTEKSRGRVSRREWESYGDGRSVEALPLVSREPHLQAAASNLAAAESGLSRAKLSLSRTVLRAPWNAVVIEAQAEVGQVVGPGTKVATLVGTDRAWVRVAVPVQRLTDLDVPGVGAEQGAAARVIQEVGNGQRVEWDGVVIRLEGQLESQTRNAQLLVAVDNPYSPPDGGLPLLPGSFVRVELEGREVSGVFSLPRVALHDGGTVWVVNDSERLANRSVEVRWGTPEDVYLTGDLRPGDRVVTSTLALPLAGEQVRVQASATDRPTS